MPRLYHVKEHVDLCSTFYLVQYQVIFQCTKRRRDKRNLGKAKIKASKKTCRAVLDILLGRLACASSMFKSGQEIKGI
jgi:hypothetical protein